MKEPWTGELVGKMHVHDVTNEDLAAELGVTKSYVSMILNCTRSPVDAKERMQAAFDRIIAKRKPASH